MTASNTWMLTKRSIYILITLRCIHFYSVNLSGFTMANRSETHKEKSVSHNPSIKSLDSKMSKFMEACSAAQFRMRMLLPSSKPE